MSEHVNAIHISRGQLCDQGLDLLQVIPIPKFLHLRCDHVTGKLFSPLWIRKLLIPILELTPIVASSPPSSMQRNNDGVLHIRMKMRGFHDTHRHPLEQGRLVQFSPLLSIARCTLQHAQGNDYPPQAHRFISEKRTGTGNAATPPQKGTRWRGLCYRMTSCCF